MKKDPVIHLSNEADLQLENLKHEARIKKHTRVFKKDILEWLIINAPNYTEVKKAFWDWVRSESKKVGE